MKWEKNDAIKCLFFLVKLNADRLITDFQVLRFFIRFKSGLWLGH